ncbi:MAG: hypothetical protein VX265_04280, partial [Myxococcota bacterium]|nr:hypothetical protein [Myxococcota bacterium]
MRSPPLLAVLLTVSLPAIGHAGSFDEDVVAAGTALKDGDVKGALALLDAAEGAAEKLEEVVDAKMLARFWFYRGVGEWMGGDGVDDGGASWRASLIADNGFEWDESVAADRDAQDFFLALTAEVRSRPRVDPAVPAATGAARIYVDGIRVRAGDLALEGVHLAQIRCPDLTVFGEWTTFSKPPRYFRKCPGGVDTSVVVEEEDVDEDDFGDMGPSFGDGSGADAAGDSGPPPDPVQDVVDTIARGARVPLTAEGAATLGEEVEVIRKQVIWPAFGAGVAVAGAAGALQVVALRQNRLYNDVDNADYQTADDLAELRRKTNRN